MRNVALIIISLGLLILSACDKNSTELEDILVLSDGFEVLGNPTHAGWQIVPELTDFDGDTPLDGSVYSLKLMPGNDIEGTAIKTIDAEHGDGIFKFSVWAKMSADQPGGTGYIKFGVLRGDLLTQRSSIELVDTLWAQLEVIDTLSFEPNDQIYIGLSCGAGHTGDQWYSLFDAVRIEKIAE